MTIIFFPFLIVGALSLGFLLLFYPFAWLFGKLEHHVYPIYLLIAIFVHCCGTADLIYDLSLLLQSNMFFLFSTHISSSSYFLAFGR